MTQVRRKRHRPSSHRLDCPRRRKQFVFTAGHQRCIRTCASKGEGCRPADAATGACNQSDFTFQVKIRVEGCFGFSHKIPCKKGSRFIGPVGLWKMVRVDIVTDDSDCPGCGKSWAIRLLFENCYRLASRQNSHFQDMISAKLQV